MSLTFFVERHSQPCVPKSACRVPPGPSHHHVRIGDGVVEERHATTARISSVEHPRSRLKQCRLLTSLKFIFHIFVFVRPIKKKNKINLSAYIIYTCVCLTIILGHVLGYQKRRQIKRATPMEMCSSSWLN